MRHLSGFAAVLIIVSLVGCDGQSDSLQPGVSAGRLISGQVAKGPLDGATVEVYAVDNRGHQQGDLLAMSLTDPNGNWSVLVPAGDEQPLLVRSSGGRYVDEADPEPNPALRRSVTLQPDDRFMALLPPGVSSVAINAYTDALLRKSLAETQGDDFHAVHATNRAFYSRAFGFDLLSTIPADPIAPQLQDSTNSRAYALALGGIANVINHYAIANGRTIANFSIINAVIDDLQDCRIDGVGLNGPVDSVTTISSDLNDEILRFRNNNFDAYSGTALLQLDLSQCNRSGRLPDVTAPVFANVPGALTLAATGPSGVGAASVTSALAGVTAIDDRDGVVAVTTNASGFLPLGNNTVVLQASDASGNTAETQVTVLVADLDAPLIDAPPSIDTMAVGLLTNVTLGEPIVSDNVSSTANLQVSNDAPIAGFPVGNHVVNWTVIDEAGLVSSDQQIVIVRNNAPVLSAPPGPQQATEGEPFTLSLVDVFADSDSALTLTLSGLPAESGLIFNVGVLGGVPSDADAQAAPLQLTLTAADETTAVAHTFQLNVVDVNNPPAFSIDTEVTLDEDFAAPYSLAPEAAPDDGPASPVYSIDASGIDFASIAVDPVSGMITINSLPDMNGQGVFTITANDGAIINNVFSQSVVVTVNAINDSPQFVLDGSVAVVPGFNGTAEVNAVPAAPPADELNDVVSYSVNHNIAYATIAVDQQSGTVSISDVADVTANAIIAVTANDGNGVNAEHTEMLSFVVRETYKTLIVGAPSSPLLDPISPIFPNPSEVPLHYSASDLPLSLSIDPQTGLISGTPTPDDAVTGVFAATVTVTGSLGTVATFPLTLNIIELDLDLDGLPDRLEPGYGTSTDVTDTDGDGIADGLEVAAGTDPLVPAGKVVVINSDEGLAALQSMTFDGASTQSPLFLLIAPGVYSADLSLNAPCGNIHVIGGMDSSGSYPLAATPTVISGNVSVDGCAQSTLQHLQLVHAETPLVIEDATIALHMVAIVGDGACGIAVDDGSVDLVDSVLDLRGDSTLVSVTDGSVHITHSLFTASGSRVLNIDDSVVQLSNVEAPAEILASPGLSVAGAKADRSRVQPEVAELKLHLNSVIAVLKFRDIALHRGYSVEAYDGINSLNVYDINRGHYRIEIEEITDIENITLSVDGVMVETRTVSEPDE